MQPSVHGIHHVTAVAGDAQRNRRRRNSSSDNATGRRVGDDPRRHTKAYKSQKSWSLPSASLT